jgi:hypothetical protein
VSGAGVLLMLRMVKVHMMMVACFMIQHGRYSDEALIWIKAQLQEHVDGVSFQEIRQRAGKAVQQANRSWKVVREAGAEPSPKVDWSVTTIDIVPFLDDPDAYCTQIEHWACVTLQEMKIPV